MVSVTCNFAIEVFVDCVEFDCNNFPPTTTAESYNCINNQCVDPGDGTGQFSSLESCEASGCSD